MPPALPAQLVSQTPQEVRVRGGVVAIPVGIESPDRRLAGARPANVPPRSPRRVSDYGPLDWQPAGTARGRRRSRPERRRTWPRSPGSTRASIGAWPSPSCETTCWSRSSAVPGTADRATRQRVGNARVLVEVVDRAQPMRRAEREVDAARPMPPQQVIGAVPGVRTRVAVGIWRRRSRRGGGRRDFGEEARRSSDRVRPAARSGGQHQHVGLPHAPPLVYLNTPVRADGRQDRAAARELGGLAELVEVGEEERLLAAIEPRQRDRPADVAAVVVHE